MCKLPLPQHRPSGRDDLCWDGQMWAPSDYGDIRRKPLIHLTGAFKQGEERRERFLADLATTGSIVRTCKNIKVSGSNYYKWRKKYPQFATKCDLALGGKISDGREYLAGFANFRRYYLDMPTTWFQEELVRILENAVPGRIILVLLPPEHGKSSLIEDFCNYRLALDPTCRISVVSEKQAHSKKILRRVKNRMEPDGPCKTYVMKFGPFVPDEAGTGRHAEQPWAADHFDVRQRGTFDERDFSMSASGITTAIQGTRADWMIIDDIQSLRSLGQTERYVEILRQDFFSRPGMFGRICILGTRVGRDDVYEKLIDEGLIDDLIIYPAHDEAGRWLWPERYSPEQYEGMRKRVGEQAWFRNYMQSPTSAQDATFTPAMTIDCLNPARSVFADCPRRVEVNQGVESDLITPVTVTLDPALGGGNGIMALGFHAKRMLYLSSRVDWNLTRNEEIFERLEETIIRWNQPGQSVVTELVIEAMAFQRGLLDDDRMREIIHRYDVRVVPHMTLGSNKYDPDIGVASMAMSFVRGEIDLPYGDKPSREQVDMLLQELYAWKPYKRGNRLRQDRVMCMWFGWIRWRAKRQVLATLNTADQFKSAASPLRVGA